MSLFILRKMNIDNLALSSKVLYDDRVLNQRKEIESLKLHIFWLENGIRAFKSAMCEFNYTKTKCACITCMTSGRCSEDDEFISGKGTFNCSFQKPFEELLNQYGLNWSDEWGDPVDDKIPDDDCGIYPKCTTVDAHFDNPGRADWYMFSFGNKLWKATNVNDVELKKYKSLLEEIDHYEDSKSLLEEIDNYKNSES